MVLPFGEGRQRTGVRRRPFGGRGWPSLLILGPVLSAGGALPAIPVIITPPVITGSTQQGQTLSASTGVWGNSPTGYAYQWLANGVSIPGATSSTLVLGGAQVGTMISVTVTATNGVGSASSTSASVGPITPSAYDYTISSDADWATVLALGGAALSGKSIGVQAMAYTTKTISLSGNAAPISFFNLSPMTECSVNKLVLQNTGTGGVVFNDMTFLSDSWQPSPLHCVTYAPGNGQRVDADYYRCETRGNYRGNTASNAISAATAYPEFACVIPQFSAGGAVTSLIITQPYVGDLVPDQTGLPLTFTNGAAGNGISFTVAPVATVDVVGGYLTNPTVVSGGSSTATSAINGSTGILSKIITWTGQAPWVLRQCNGHFSGRTGTGVIGRIRYLSGRLRNLNNAFKVSPNTGAPVEVSYNDLDNVYQDYVSIGVSGASMPLPPLKMWFNRATTQLARVGHAADPHGDFLQTFMDDVNSPFTSQDWDIDVVGNVFWKSPYGGVPQNLISEVPTVNNVGYRGRYIYNILLGGSDGSTRSHSVDRVRDMLFWRNTAIVYDRALTNSIPNIVVGSDPGNTPLGNDYVAGNMGDALQLLAGSGQALVSNIVLGAGGSNIPYTTAMPSFVDAPASFAAVIAAVATGGAYASAGYNPAQGVVDYAARTIDLTKIHPGIVWPDLTGQPTSTEVWSVYWRNLSGEVVSVSVPSGAKLQVADDASGTNALAPVVGPATTTIAAGKYARAALTTSGSGAAQTTVTLTMNGYSVPFRATTASAAAFVTIDNQATAYSRIAGIPVETGIRRVVVAFRMKADLVAISNLLANDSTNNVRVWLPSTAAFRAVFFNSARVQLRPVLTPDTAMKTHIITMDLTNPSASQGCYWATIEDGVILNNNPGSGGTFDTRSTAGTGTDYGSFTSATNGSTGLFGPGLNLGVFAEADGGGTFFDGRFDFLYMDWGGAGYTIPDITQSGVRNLWLPDNIGANGSGPTGAQPKLFHTATDLAEANSAGGMPNRGSLASVPLVKQAGTYV